MFCISTSIGEAMDYYTAFVGFVQSAKPPIQTKVWKKQNKQTNNTLSHLFVYVSLQNANINNTLNLLIN